MQPGPLAVTLKLLFQFFTALVAVKDSLTERVDREQGVAAGVPAHRSSFEGIEKRKDLPQTPSGAAASIAPMPPPRRSAWIYLYLATPVLEKPEYRWF